MEFAEGKWAPFVFFELQEAANVVPEISHIEFFENLTWDQISDALGPCREMLLISLVSFRTKFGK